MSFTVCHRFQIFYERPRMYIFTYAYDDKDANELYSGLQFPGVFLFMYNNLL